ncbi:DUF4199 family protein [Flavobacterium sp.]|uniref:DUF4199 family protein n=1 Tax=Flavobacterium sp. TaxID=239 RepID=UPI00286C066E|nr:DUF4199 family protein [Flavobacterium sp.]
MNSIIKRNGFFIGLILGLIHILITCYLFFSQDPNAFTDLKIGMLKIFISILFGIIALLIVKHKMNNLIGFKDAFTSYFIVNFVSSILSFLFFFVLFNSFSSDVKRENIKKSMVEFQIKTMKQNNSSDIEIAKVRESFISFNPFSFIQGFNSTVKYLLRDSLIGLIVALIFRNQKVPL